MRRVVVTGMGVVSSIGNNKSEVLEALREGRSGVAFVPEYAELGFRSHVAGTVKMDIEARVERRLRRFMGDGACYNYVAMEEAIADSGLEAGEVSNERTGLIMGSGGTSTKDLTAAYQIAKDKGPKRVGPFMVPRVMSNTNSATLATPFKIKGVNYSITSACATSAHCIGNAMETIQLGKQDVMFAGGGEELSWTASVLFDAMPALSSGYNDRPEKASRGGRLYTPEFGTRMRGTGIFANLLERRFDRTVRQHDFNRHAWRPTIEAFRPPVRSGDQLRLL